MATNNPLNESFPAKPKTERSTASVFALLENVNADIQNNKKMLLKMGVLSACMAVMVFFLCVAGAYYVKDTVVDPNHDHVSVQLDRHTGNPMATMGATAPVSIEAIMRGEKPASDMTTLTYDVGKIARTREVVGVDVTADCEYATEEEMCVVFFTSDDAIIFAPTRMMDVVPLSQYSVDLLNPSDALMADLASDREAEEEEAESTGRKLQGAKDAKGVVDAIAFLGKHEGFFTPSGDSCSNASVNDEDVISFDFTAFKICAPYGGATYTSGNCQTLSRGQTCFFSVVNNERCQWEQFDANFNIQYESCWSYLERDVKTATAVQCTGFDCQSSQNIAINTAKAKFADCLATSEGSCTKGGVKDNCVSANNGNECAAAKCAPGMKNCRCDWGYERTSYTYAPSGSGSGSSATATTGWYSCSRIRHSRSKARCQAYTADSSRKASCKPVDASASGSGIVSLVDW